MAIWDPGQNPFPDGEIDEITDFEYLDELKFVRHASPHFDLPPQSLWQLSADFRVRLTVHPEDGAPYSLVITAPRGLYTDLSSVPELLWSLVGPIGKHLEASIVHDYLYMAWTDFREEAMRDDWDFADAVLQAGMKASDVDNWWIIYHAVHNEIGWCVFKDKPYTLRERMTEWLHTLEPGHGRGDPGSV